MKQKVFNKKLVLNKETVSNLENSDMDSARGGTASITLPPCLYTAIPQKLSRCICEL